MPGVTSLPFTSIHYEYFNFRYAPCFMVVQKKKDFKCPKLHYLNPDLAFSLKLIGSFHGAHSSKGQNAIPGRNILS